MNAYELADELDKINDIPIETIINMLHQQADRIRNLEKTLGFKNSGYETINLTPMPEPVAYVNSMCNDCIDWKIEPMSIDGQPLYTTPQIKELSDAEIRTIQDMCHLKNVGYNTFIMRFARAILKKASEK